MSVDRHLVSTEADQMVEETITFLPDENDGILKTFIDRYTTMLVHDSILKEEIPSGHNVFGGIIRDHRTVEGGLKHDPRYIQTDYLVSPLNSLE